CPYIVTVSPGEKPPPWCPRCGANLKLEEPASATRNPPQVASAWDAADPRGAVQEAKAPTAAGETLAAPPAPFGQNTPVSSSLLSADLPATSSVQDEVFRGNLLWQAVAVLTLLACLGIVAIAVSQLVGPRHGKPIQTGVYGVIGLFGVGALIA